MLNPYQLTPTASLNRVKIVTAPGLPPIWKGKTANELLGRWAIIQLLRDNFPDLQNLPDPFPEFERRHLAQNHPAAEAIAAQMGVRLACLVQALKLGAAENRAARPEWDESYWTHWASIERVIVGGGIVAGLLGRRMVAHARLQLESLIALDVARDAAYLPLLGAALKLSAAPALAFDFGNTAIKRAVFHDRTLTTLPSVPAAFPTDAKELLSSMVAVIVETWRSVQPRDLAPQIMVSVANYVPDCQVAPNTSYGQLLALGENTCVLLSAAVSRALDREISVTLIHDGTAAAYVYAGSPRTAVITLGTALGVGFPPPDEPAHADVVVQANS